MDKRSIFSELSPRDREFQSQQIEGFKLLDPQTQLTVFRLRQEVAENRASRWSRAVAKGDQSQKIVAGYDWNRYADANIRLKAVMSEEAKLRLDRIDISALYRHHTLKERLTELLVLIRYYALIDERYSP